MIKARDNTVLTQNKAYLLRKSNEWKKYDPKSIIELNDSHTVAIKYTESFNSLKILAKWKLIVAYQTSTGLREMSDKLICYSHAICDDKNSRKVTHYIVLYFKTVITLQDLSLMTVPLRLPRKDGYICLLKDNDYPKSSLTHKFNFHVEAHELAAFLDAAANYTASDMEYEEEEVEVVKQEAIKRPDKIIMSKEQEETVSLSRHTEVQEDRKGSEVEHNHNIKDHYENTLKTEKEGDFSIQVIVTDKRGTETFTTSDLNKHPQLLNSIVEMKTMKRLKRYAEDLLEEVEKDESKLNQFIQLVTNKKNL